MLVLNMVCLTVASPPLGTRPLIRGPILAFTFDAFQGVRAVGQSFSQSVWAGNVEDFQATLDSGLERFLLHEHGVGVVHLVEEVLDVVLSEERVASVVNSEIRGTKLKINNTN
jgi:hypothetical protein